MLHFGGGVTKPLPLNVINRRTLVAAYGDDDEHWRGRPVEIYVDPNVTNSRGEITGGIRVRIPVAPARPVVTRPALPANPSPAPAPELIQPPTKPAAAVPTREQRHAIVVEAYALAQTESRVTEWTAWAARQGFTPPQLEQQADASRAALARIAKTSRAGR